MSNFELLEQLRQLSRVEKFNIMRFLMAELAREEGLVLENEASDILGAVHTSNQGAKQLMQLLEMEEKQPQNA